MLKGQKGITLVALVVTIIVLIILAGVSIALVLGDYGIINRTRQAGNEYRGAINSEKSDLANLDEYINTIL